MKKEAKILVTSVMMMCWGGWVWGQTELSNLRVEQIPGTKTVQVTYDLVAEDGVEELSVGMEFSKDAGDSWESAVNAYGAVGPGVVPGTDLVAYWEAGLDDPENLVTAGQIKLLATAEGILAPAGMARIVIDEAAYNPFQMGSPETEDRRDSDETQHEVTLTQPYFLQERPVDEAQWLLVAEWAMENGYADLTGVHTYYDSVNPTWYEAVAWCNARSEREGLEPVYYEAAEMTAADVVRTASPEAVMADWTADGYRLPTEAEWEYACRAGTTSPYFSGDAAPEDYGEEYIRDLSIPNAFGLYGMHSGDYGNWCWDRYGAYADQPVTDPRGPDTGTMRVVRGNGRSADREELSPTTSRIGSWGASYATLRPARSLVSGQ